MLAFSSPITVVISRIAGGLLSNHTKSRGVMVASGGQRHSAAEGAQDQ